MVSPTRCMIGRTPSHLPPISTAGAMNEVNMTIWPVLYGVTGHAVGSLFGMGAAGAVVGVLLGFVTGIVMMIMSFMDIEAFAPMAFVPIVIFVPAPIKVWLMGAVCLSAWVRMIPRAVEGATGKKAVRKLVAEIAACTSPNKLVPFLGDDRHRVVTAAGDRLYSLRLMHAKVAKVILKHADTLDRSHSANRDKCRWLCDLVTPLTEAGPKARDALLDLYANLGWLRDAVGRYAQADENADLLVEEVLFEQFDWEDDAPLLEVTEGRMSQGWNVDAMVHRLLASDHEAGLLLAERAFLTGSLTPDRLDALGDDRAGAVLREAVGRGSGGDGPRWDDIIDGALARPTRLAFSLMAAVLRTEDDAYHIDSRTEYEFLKVEDGHLSRRHEAPDEAAELLDAARSRTAWLREHPDLIGQPYKLTVMRDLERSLED